MSTRKLVPTWFGLALLSLFCTPPVHAQFSGTDQNDGTFSFTVDAASQQIDLPQGTSRRLAFDFSIPELLIDNPEFVRATPISANEIVISGLRTGLANLTVTDSDKKRTVISINVTPDVRRLEMALASHFKSSSIRVFPLNDGVMLAGTVARADDVDVVMEVAKNYIPTNVINRLSVDGSQIVATEVKIYEVSRTKLRNLGVDWSVVGRDFNIVSGFADVITNLSNTTNTQSKFKFGVIDDDLNIDVFIRALEKRNLAKLMASPTLVAQNGRAAQFLSGGEIPFQVNSGFGNNSIQFRPFGTQLDLVPIVHGQGELTLEIRAEVSEVAADLNGGTSVPGFRVRRVDTAVPMRAGQTLALAGDYREKIDNEVKGTPWLMNKANWGIPFRNTKSEENETELVFILTPKFISPVDTNQVAGPLPTQTTAQPSNSELYNNAYLEVPRCEGDSCPAPSSFLNGMTTAPQGIPLSENTAAPTTGNTTGHFGYPNDTTKPVGFERDRNPGTNDFEAVPNSNPQGYFDNRPAPSQDKYGYPTTQTTSRNTTRVGQRSGVRR